MKYEADKDYRFNHAMFGHLVFSLEKSNFSREDIDYIINCIERISCEVNTNKDAAKYMNDIWSGQINLDHLDRRANRIKSDD